MLKAIRKRMEDREEGFTLIELMVVVLIIAILIAIAIPTFLGARRRAQDRAAQSNLRNGLTAEKVYYTDSQEYVDDSAGDLTDIEPALTYQVGTVPTDGSATQGEVYVAVGDANTTVCLSVESASGAVFYLADVAIGDDAGTYYNRTAPAACAAANVNGWSKTGW